MRATTFSLLSAAFALANLFSTASALPTASLAAAALEAAPADVGSPMSNLTARAVVCDGSQGTLAKPYRDVPLVLKRDGSTFVQVTFCSTYQEGESNNADLYYLPCGSKSLDDNNARLVYRGLPRSISLNSQFRAAYDAPVLLPPAPVLEKGPSRLAIVEYLHLNGVAQQKVNVHYVDYNIKLKN